MIGFMPRNYLKNAKACFREESFAIIKAKHTHPEAFANITDQYEITVIIDQNKLGNSNYPEFKLDNLSELEKNWKLLTLDVVFSLNTVGILARISGVLAEKGISIMAISAYSRDHFLIREEDMKKAILALEAIGISAK
jgi:hypothetical protein